MGFGGHGFGPQSDGVALNGLLAGAQLYIDASRRGGNGVNSGTAGAALDGTGPVVFPSREKAALYGGDEAQASTCPDAAALDLTDGFIVAVDAAQVWDAPLPTSLLAKPRTGGTAPGQTNDCYAVGVGDDGTPYIEWYDGAHHGPAFLTGNDATEDVVLDGTDRYELVWRFVGDNDEGGWTAQIYDGAPAEGDFDVDGLELLSEIVNTDDGAQTLDTSGELLRVGDLAYGAIYRVRLYNLDGTLLRDFYPDRDHTAGTSFTADTGEVWSNVLVPAAPAFGYLQIPDDAALDVPADEDATFAFWFTTPYLADVDGEAYTYANRETGNLGQNGNGITVRDLKIVAFGVDFMGAIVGDGADQGVATSNAGWAAGTRLVVVTINRGTDTLTIYRDGVSHATADITDVAAINPPADLILSWAAHHAVAKWDEVLAPAAVAAART